MDQTRRVQLVGQIPVDDYARLQCFAERRGIVHKASGRPNVSRALREVVTAGLAVLESDAREVKHDEN